MALTGAAMAAGAINAVAGGGTLVTFPALLGFGTPPLVANATSTLALMAGTAGSVLGYRNHVAAIRAWLWKFGPVSIAGGAIGSWLLTRTTDRVFARLVPFLILFATVVFLLQGVFNRFATPDPNRASHVWAAVAFQFAVALYGGYFGAGIGILMLASLGLLGLTNLHEMNALKTLLSAAINLVATGVFVAAGIVDWPRAAAMTAGALVGYFLGSHWSQRIAVRHVRRLIAVIGISLSVATFWREFAR
jgi:hypothetical protein